MVKTISSQLFIPQEKRIPIYRSHSDMVKFTAPTDLAYKLVRDHIQEHGNLKLNCMYCTKPIYISSDQKYSYIKDITAKPST